LKLTAVILLAALLLRPALAAETQGTICIAPIPVGAPTTSAPGLMCVAGNLSLRIDSQSAMAWPRGGSQKIEGLDVGAPHRVVVLCDGKPQQSFRFRFSQFKSQKLCLFINDLYQTAQLWEASRSPWCKCR
jgi:hypothetical protein